MANQKVELEQVSDDGFRVMKLTNRIEPMVGSTITKRDVKELLACRNRNKINVVIVPAKEIIHVG